MLGADIERDPKLINLTDQAMGLMKSIADENDQLVGYIPEPKFTSNIGLSPGLSFEEAIKELHQMQKNNNMMHGARAIQA
jgi:hypothetical protein